MWGLQQAEMLNKRKVNKFLGKFNEKEKIKIGEGYEIIYLDKTSTRNGVWE